jgi:hypothetical protein
MGEDQPPPFVEDEVAPELKDVRLGPERTSSFQEQLRINAEHPRAEQP